jgi:hypothetical protein
LSTVVAILLGGSNSQYKPMDWPARLSDEPNKLPISIEVFSNPPQEIYDGIQQVWRHLKA